jgi:hypothetical protein
MEGSGRWNLTDYATVEIVIDTVCTGLSGNFTIHKGVLILNANLTTTGNFEFRSLASASQITVAQGVVATFD